RTCPACAPWCWTRSTSGTWSRVWRSPCSANSGGSATTCRWWRCPRRSRRPGSRPCWAGRGPDPFRWWTSPRPRIPPTSATARRLPPAGARRGRRGPAGGVRDHAAAVTAEEGGATGVAALVALRGVREIERVVRSLEHRLGARAEVRPLHGRLDGAAQDRAVSGGGRGVPRVVVSTDLAESSLTVPGVRLVVDACLGREPRRDTVRDMTGLVTVSASRDSCVQRAGRAARLGPGTALRLLSEDE